MVVLDRKNDIEPEIIIDSDDISKIAPLYILGNIGCFGINGSKITMKTGEILEVEDYPGNIIEIINNRSETNVDVSISNGNGGGKYGYGLFRHD